MRISDGLIDFLDMFNFIDRAEGALAGLFNFERGTHGNRLRKRGLTEMSIDRAAHVPQEVEEYLRRYGVPIHGRRITSKEAIFSVSDQQAEWTRYLLERMGVNPPPAWQDGEKKVRR